MADWTLAEAAAWLDPAITEDQLRAVVLAIGVEPVPQNNRHHERRGRPVKRYDVAGIIKLHRALFPWLDARDPADVAEAIIVP